MGSALETKRITRQDVGTESLRVLLRILQYGILLFVAFLFLFPFTWTVISSFKRPAELLIVPIQWFPKVVQWENYSRIFTAMPFTRSLGNSLLVSTSVALSVIFFGSMAGFALAKYRFKGQNLYLTFVLATMMVPYFVFLMPTFFMVYTLGWVDTYWALIVPNCVTAFGVFFMRQFIESTVPDELIDAARIDGCSDFRLFVTIVMPLCKSAYLVLGVVTFIANWNDFLWPLIVTQSKDMYTLQVLLSTLQESYGSMKFMPLLMAGTTIAIIPGLMLFILAQRQIVQGISVTGFK
jgi:ABC-type glycerol-3-phosphate transport system permease component